jgi:hypothetical protein
MTEARALTACLTRLGFDIPTRELIDRQGIRTLKALTVLPFPEIDKMIQHLSRWKPRASGAQGEDDPAPTFPYLAVRRFKALRAWADYCILSGGVPSPADFVERNVARFLNCLTEFEEIARAKKDGDEFKEPPKLVSLTSWPTWLEFLFTNYLAQHARSVVACTPLVYVIHDKDEVSDEDMARNDWDLVDDGHGESSLAICAALQQEACWSRSL